MVPNAGQVGTLEQRIVGLWYGREVRLWYTPPGRLPAGTIPQPFVGPRYAQLGPYQSARVP